MCPEIAVIKNGLKTRSGDCDIVNKTGSLTLIPECTQFPNDSSASSYSESKALKFVHVYSGCSRLQNGDVMSFL
jgi:hypothetical protein